MPDPIGPNRRDMLRTVLGTALYPLLAGCAGSASLEAPALEFADDAATVRGDNVVIELARVPQWRSPAIAESAVVFLAAQVIVVRRPLEQFSAFSAVCPHAGCGVSGVRTDALVCPCHGSTFAFDGTRLSGPAPSGLTPLPVTYDGSAGRLMVRRANP